MSTSNNPAYLPLYTEEVFFTVQPEISLQADLGLFEKKILLLYVTQELNAATDEMMRKMMNSCRLSENDYYRVGLNSPHELLAAIRQFQPETVLVFGIAWENGSFNVKKPLYKPFRFAGMKCLLSDGIQTLQDKPELKKTLWNNGLKYIFEIN